MTILFDSVTEQNEHPNITSHAFNTQYKKKRITTMDVNNNAIFSYSVSEYF